MQDLSQRTGAFILVLSVLFLAISSGCTDYGEVEGNSQSVPDSNISGETINETDQGVIEGPGNDSTQDLQLKEVKLIIFHSPTCGYCRNELKWLEEEIIPRYPNLVVEKYVASENLELYEQMAAEYNTTTGGVPRTFINGRVYVGFTKTEANLTYVPAYGGYSGNANQIEAAIIEGSE